MSSLKRQDGNILQIVSDAAYTNDIPVKIGAAMFGVPVKTVATATDVGVEVEGVFALPKVSGTSTYTVGDRVYWSASTSKATKSTTDELIGVCSKAATLGATEVEVMIADGMIMLAPMAKTVTVLADDNAVMSAAAIAAGYMTIASTAPRTKATAASTAIIALMPGALTGVSFDFSITNTGASTLTITAGVGVTLVGTPALFIMGATSAKAFRVVQTSAILLDIIALS